MTFKRFIEKKYDESEGLKEGDIVFIDPIMPNPIFLGLGYYYAQEMTSCQKKQFITNIKDRDTIETHSGWAWLPIWITPSKWMSSKDDDLYGIPSIDELLLGEVLPATEQSTIDEDLEHKRLLTLKLILTNIVPEMKRKIIGLRNLKTRINSFTFSNILETQYRPQAGAILHVNGEFDEFFNDIGSGTWI